MFMSDDEGHDRGIAFASSSRRLTRISSDKQHKAFSNLVLQNSFSNTIISLLNMGPIATAFSALFALYITYAVWTWHRLSHIPGPFWAGISKVWLIREAFLGRQPTTLRDVTNEYGEFAVSSLAQDTNTHTSRYACACRTQ
jgi:hypothetical protein